MNRLFLLSLSLLFIISCSDDDSANYLYQNNFDNYSDWGFSSGMLRSGDAHSGDWYCELDTIAQYSIGFKKKVKDLVINDFKTATLSAWVKVPSLSSKANLVLAIGLEGQEAVVWEGIKIEDQVSEENKWTRITGEVPIPNNLNPEFNLNVYMWNNGTTPIKVDDIAFDLW